MSGNKPTEAPCFANVKVDGLEYQIYLTSPARDYIQNGLAIKGIPYELPMLEDMRTWLSPESVVLDIGANIGNHTFYLSNVVKCKVIAFEPNDDLAHAMDITVSETGLCDLVTVYSYALGEKPGFAEFERDIPENLGSQSLLIGKGRVKVKALDSVGISLPVHAIKIDVEGMELQVLKGGKKLIDAYKPVLYVECQKKADFVEITSYLASLGYGYQNTFNATPTHLFTHNSHPRYNDQLEKIIIERVYAEYDLLDITRKLKIEVKEKQLAYDSLYQKHTNSSSDADRLRQELASTALSAGKIDQLNLEVEDLHEKLANSTLQCESLKKELASERAEKELQLRQFVQNRANKIDAAVNEKLTLEVERLAAENRSQKALLKGQESISLELADSKKKISELQFVLDGAQLEVKQAQTERNSLLARLDEDSKIIAVHKELTLRGAETQQQYDELKLQYDRRSYEYTELLASYEALKLDFAGLSKEKEEQECALGELSEISAKYDDLLNTYQQQEALISSLQESIAQYSKQQSYFENVLLENKTIQIELAELKERLQTEGSALVRIQELEEQIGELKLEQHEYEQRLSSLSHEHTAYVDGLKAQYHKQRIDLEAQMQVLIQKKIDSLGPLQANQEKIDKLIKYRNEIEQMYAERTPLLAHLESESDAILEIRQQEQQLAELVQDLRTANGSSSGKQ